MELTKIQMIALIVLTTIITNKYLINRPVTLVIIPASTSVNPTIIVTPTTTSQLTTTLHSFLFLFLYTFRNSKIMAYISLIISITLHFFTIKLYNKIYAIF